MAGKAPKMPLPSDWPGHVKAAILHVISLARLALVAARGRAAVSRKTAVRLRAELDEARREISLLEEEFRLKDLRMARVRPRRRPHYRPVERMAVLELRAARGWSTAQTAERFFLQKATIAEWMKRIDEDGERALLQTREPANRLPDFVRYIVQRLKVLCPTMGKKRLAQTLARAGLVLGVSTVARMLKEREGKRPEPTEGAAIEESVRTKNASPVRSRGRNDIWQIDLTVVPTAAGFWTAWLPFSAAQIWLFSWCIACVVDHYSRRIVGFTVFSKEPKSIDIRRFLGRVVSRVGAIPKYIISDKGRQFDCAGFKAWCRHRGIESRYASTGSLRATAVIERFFRSLKDEWLRRIPVPLGHDAMRQRVSCYLLWFEQHRPHQSLGGRTPREIYDGESPEEKDGTRADGERPLELVVRFHGKSRHLPIAELKQAA